MGERTECDKATSAERFISGAIGNGMTWGAAGFFFGEALGFGVGGAPGAAAGVVFGEAVNLASFGSDYLSCKLSNRTIVENASELIQSMKGRSNYADLPLPNLKIDK